MSGLLAQRSAFRILGEKKMAKAATKTEPKSLANWDQRLADLGSKFKKTTDSIAQGGAFISLSGGIMKYKQTQVPNNELLCVVLGYVPENTYFIGKFDPDTPQSPVCYAMAESRDEMAPAKNAYKPQFETCKGCPQNEWQSA